MCRRAVHVDDAGCARRFDGISGETFAIGHIVDVQLLEGDDARCIQQIPVNGAGAFIVRIGVRYRGTV